MRTPIVNRDPGDEQPTLFAEPQPCTATGCQAGSAQNLCGHDADIHHGLKDPYALRPVQCLLAHPRADAQIPY